MKHFLIILFSFSLLSGFSQGKDFEPKGTLKFDLQLPLVLGNSPFKSIMKGMIRPQLYYQHNVFKGLTVGAGGGYTLWFIDEFSLNGLRGYLHEINAFGKLSYQKFMGEKFGLEIGVKGGYAYHISANDSCTVNLGKAYQEGTYFVEPMLGLELKVNEALGINLAVGWVIYGNTFDERYVGQKELPGGDVYKKSNSNMINLGFGVSYYFGYKPSLNTQ